VDRSWSSLTAEIYFFIGTWCKKFDISRINFMGVINLQMGKASGIPKHLRYLRFLTIHKDIEGRGITLISDFGPWTHSSEP